MGLSNAILRKPRMGGSLGVGMTWSWGRAYPKLHDKMGGPRPSHAAPLSRLAGLLRVMLVFAVLAHVGKDTSARGNR